MFINKLVFKAVDIEIGDVEIPDMSMLSQIPTISHPYWLKDYDKQRKKAYMADFLTVVKTEPTNTAAIRPVIKFTPQNTDEIKTGDTLLIKNFLFTVFKPGWAICNSVIDFSMFFKYTSKTIQERVSYYSSVAHHIINKWKTKSANIYLKPVYKVTERVPCSFNDAHFTLLSYKDAHEMGPGLLETGYGYWLKDRATEFVGRSITIPGSPRQADISKSKYICPAVYLDKNSDFSEQIKPCEMFQYEGKLYKVLPAPKRIHNNTILALCLNPIGCSCYSTGIEEVSDADKETTFYLHSEACACIQNWRKKEEEENLWK